MKLVGMIDWLTLFIDASLLDRDSMKRCLDNADKIQRINGLTGEVEWTTNCRQQVTSDSHYLTISFGSRLKIEGSPARVLYPHNVFGSLDIQQCALDMISFAAQQHGVFLPRNLKKWTCSKIDVTQNFDMGSLVQGQQAIDYLKAIKLGRQKTATKDTSVMWGEGSTLHMGKAYLKGVQLRKLVQKNNADVSEENLKKADRLLRLEYSIRRLMIRRIRESSGLEWHQYTPEFLLALHTDYFSKFISTIEVVDMCNVLDLLLANVGGGKNNISSVGQARAAYGCYTNIRMNGFHIAKDTYTKSSWYRNVQNLKTVGLVAADLQPINVVPLLRRQIVLDEPVSSWDQIKLAQGA